MPQRISSDFSWTQAEPVAEPAGTHSAKLVLAGAPHEKQKRENAFLRVVQRPQWSNRPMPQ
jgi:hypothetical protein